MADQGALKRAEEVLQHATAVSAQIDQETAAMAAARDTAEHALAQTESLATSSQEHVSWTARALRSGWSMQEAAAATLARAAAAGGALSLAAGHALLQPPALLDCEPASGRKSVRVAAHLPHLRAVSRSSIASVDLPSLQLEGEVWDAMGAEHPTFEDRYEAALELLDTAAQEIERARAKAQPRPGKVPEKQRDPAS